MDIYMIFQVLAGLICDLESANVERVLDIRSIDLKISVGIIGTECKMFHVSILVLVQVKLDRGLWNSVRDD